MIAWIASCGSAFSIASLKCSSGAAECAGDSTPVTRKLRSGTARLLQLRKEPADLAPHLVAAGEPAPAHADHARQPVALIDRDDEVVAGGADAVDQQRFDIRLNL